MKDFLLTLGDGGLGRLARHGETTPGDWKDSRSRQFWRDRQLLGLSTTKSRSRDLDHLELRRAGVDLPRRLHGGGNPGEPRDRPRHGGKLLDETDEVVRDHGAR